MERLAIVVVHVMPRVEKYAFQKLVGETIDTSEEIRLLSLADLLFLGEECL